MKYRIITISEINKCHNHRLDPDHYMPSHRTEDCAPPTQLDLFRKVRLNVQNVRNERISDRTN